MSKRPKAMTKGQITKYRDKLQRTDLKKYDHLMNEVFRVVFEEKYDPQKPKESRQRVRWTSVADRAGLPEEIVRAIPKLNEFQQYVTERLIRRNLGVGGCGGGSGGRAVVGRTRRENPLVFSIFFSPDINRIVTIR